MKFHIRGKKFKVASKDKMVDEMSTIWLYFVKEANDDSVLEDHLEPEDQDLSKRFNYLLEINIKELKSKKFAIAFERRLEVDFPNRPPLPSAIENLAEEIKETLLSIKRNKQNPAKMFYRADLPGSEPTVGASFKFGGM